jgi:uncharacterized membrane protein
MADKDDVILKIKEKIAKLDRASAKAYREQLTALNNGNSALETFHNLLEDIDTRIEDQSRGFTGLLSEIKKINEELSKEDKHIRDATKSFRGLESIASKLKDDQKGYTTLNEKQLNQEKSKLKSFLDQARAAAEQLAIDKGIVDLAHVNLAFRHDLSEEERAILTAAQGNFSIYERTNKLLEDRIKEEKHINSQLGLTGKLMKGITKIPIVGQFIDADEALKKMRESVEAGGGKLAALGAGFKSVGGDIVSGMADPLFILTGILKIFTELDSAAGAFAKSQNMSYNDALKAREHYSSMAASSGDLSLNARTIQESQAAIGAQLGTNAELNKEDLQTFTKLREQAGYTNEELAGIQQLSLVNGKSLEKNTSEILGGAKAYASRNKLVVNEKQILKDISKASASLKLSLGGSANELARSAVQAKQFGLNLEQAEKMSQSLLDFESSIESELSAELLTGKDLNLERARGLALNGDSAAAAAEIAAQVGSAADFGKMNVIQQEAIAKAVGMQRDELAQSLIDKESLAKLGAKEGETALQAYQAMKDRGMTEAQIAEELGDKELAKQYEQQSNAEKFAQTIENIKEIFISIVDGPLGSILSGLSTMMKSAGVVYTVFGLIAAVMAGNMLIGLGKMIAQLGIALGLSTARAIAEVTAAEALTLGVATVAIVAGLAAVGGLMYSMMKGNDVMSTPPGYGKRTLMGPEGAIQLNDKDTVIAGTNLFGNDVKSEPGKATQMGNKGEIKVKSEGGDMSAVITAINALASRPINVSVQIDGKELILAQAKFPNTQGDENRKNSYKI